MAGRDVFDLFVKAIVCLVQPINFSRWTEKIEPQLGVRLAKKARTLGAGFCLLA